MRAGATYAALAGMAAALPAGAVPADAAARASCLAARVAVESAELSGSGRFDRMVRATIRNGLDWAISGAVVEYRVFTEGRAVPWTRERIGLNISGGIEPGETRTINVNSLYLSADAAEPLVVMLDLLDVSGQDGLPLIGEHRYGTRDGETTSRHCGT